MALSLEGCSKKLLVLAFQILSIMFNLSMAPMQSEHYWPSQGIRKGTSIRMKRCQPFRALTKFMTFWLLRAKNISRIAE
ncbi:hypothetical protein A9D60_17455 [Leisingera sp. JC1]|nr:hypothetical protein A9D60_17455 [Leisingera sp. JC1]